MPLKSIGVLKLAVTHVEASVDVRINPPSPTATKVPFVYATAVSDPGVPDCAGVQTAPSFEIRMVALPKESLPPTATKVSAPKVMPFNNASVPELPVVQLNSSEERIRPCSPTATKMPLP